MCFWMAAADGEHDTNYLEIFCAFKVPLLKETSQQLEFNNFVIYIHELNFLNWHEKLATFNTATLQHFIFNAIL